MKNIIQFAVRHIPRPVLIRLSYVARKPISLFYKGDNYECPVCEKSFRKLLPYGNLGKENRLCPSCLSLERHRLLWLFLKEKTDFFHAPAKVLHIAPEQPFLKRFRNLENLEYTTADLLSPIADVKTDIRDMVFENNRFDWVVCNHVLEHIDEEQKALKEILRVLKPGRKAILQVPIDYSLEETYEDPSITSRKEREKHFGQYDHLRLYGKDYEKRLQKAGFETDANPFVKELPEELQERFRLDPQELVYYCQKPLSEN